MELFGQGTIIEFNGIPATGKTTIAKALEAELLRNEIKSKRDYCLKQNRVIGLLLDPDLFSFFLKVVRFSLDYPFDLHRVKFIFGLLDYYRKYKAFLRREKHQVLIVDQGIIQSIISLVYQNSIIPSRHLVSLLEHLNKNRIRFLMVNCSNDMQLALGRLKNRPRTTARVYGLSDEDLYKTYELQEQNFRVVRSLFTTINTMSECIYIDTNYEPKENAVLILNHLIHE